MGAYVSHKFNRGFILDEERLRKLNQLIIERIGGTETKLQFKVYRGDAFSYETDDLDQVLAEDNADWRKVSRLHLFTDREEALRFRLSFSDVGTALDIEGDNRDQVFVLFSDLRQYLEEEVNRKLPLNPISVRAIGMLLSVALMPVAMWLMVYDIKSRIPTKTLVDAAVAANDLGKKLDFLITITARPPVASSIWVPVLFLLAIVGFALSAAGVPLKMVNFFLPANIFLFGAQRVRLERRMRLLGNVLWVVAIGFLVSVLAGFLVWYITSRT